MKIFSPGQVLLAAIFGGPIGAALLMIINERNNRRLKSAITIGVIAALLLAAIGLFTAFEFPFWSIGIVVAATWLLAYFRTALLAHQLQEDKIPFHKPSDLLVLLLWLPGLMISAFLVFICVYLFLPRTV